MNKSYLEVVSTISKMIAKFASQEKNTMISEIIASRIDIPWKKSEISQELGTPRQICSAMLHNKELIFWIIKNMIYGLLLIFRMLIALAKKPKSTQPICLLYSLTASQIIHGHKNLMDFLGEPRLDLNIHRNTRIIVELSGLSKKRQVFQPNLIYVEHVSSFYFEEYLTFSQRLKVLLNSLCRAIHLFYSAKLIDLIFFRQTILESEIDKIMLTQKENTLLITSQTNLRKLPTVFYLESLPHIDRIMIWYSNNSFVIEKKSEIDEFDSTRYVRPNIDTHFGWGEEWKSQLESMNPSSSIRNVGSLMWYPKISIPTNKLSDKIVVFDVIPFSSFQHYSFYSSGLVSSFLFDIYESINQYRKLGKDTIEYTIFLKQKRKFDKNTDPAYIDLLRNLEKSENFKVLSSDENLYHLISSSRAVIGLPFVSPVTIAKEMLVPCCYYVGAENSEWSIPKELDGVEVILGKEKLQNWLERSL